LEPALQVLVPLQVIGVVPLQEFVTLQPAESSVEKESVMARVSDRIMRALCVDIFGSFPFIFKFYNRN